MFGDTTQDHTCRVVWNIQCYFFQKTHFLHYIISLRTNSKYFDIFVAINIMKLDKQSIVLQSTLSYDSLITKRNLLYYIVDKSPTKSKWH